MRIVIISAFDPIPGDSINLIRYGKLAEELANSGHNVIYITSSFFHLDKAQRKSNIWSDKFVGQIKLTFLKTMTYKNHSGLKRIVNHFQFAIKTRRVLKKIINKEKPHLIVSAFPPILSNYYSSKIAKKFNIPFIIDIQDLWPEAFQLLFRNRFFTNTLLFPLFIIRNKTFRLSTQTAGVSETYLEYIRENIVKKPGKSFPLGMDFDKFQKNIDTKWNKMSKTSKERWITYVGSSKSIAELMTLFEIASEFPDYQFIILGKGNNQNKLKRIAGKYNQANIHILGEQIQENMVNILAKSDVGLVLADPKSYIFLPNKTFSYLSAGLPLISNIKSSEITEIAKIQGFDPFYKSGNSFQLKEKIREAVKVTNLQKEDIKKFAKENYDSSKIYKNFRFWLEKINTPYE